MVLSRVRPLNHGQSRNGRQFRSTITGRILGYGTVLVHGAGGDISPFDVVANPQLFQRALMDAVEHTK